MQGTSRLNPIFAVSDGSLANICVVDFMVPFAGSHHPLRNSTEFLENMATLIQCKTENQLDAKL